MSGERVLLQFVDFDGNPRQALISILDFRWLISKADKFDEAQAKRKGEVPHGTNYYPFRSPGTPWFKFYEAAGAAAQAFEEFSQNAGPPPSKDKYTRLHQLAGVKRTSTNTLPSREYAQKLVRKAKRNCHPDTGGHKDLWYELEDICKRLGLKF